MKKFYITTAIEYANSTPHIGHAFEKVGADVLARFKRMCGYETFFLMGNDEHSTNVEKNAQSMGISAMDFCNTMEEKFKNLWGKLDLSYDVFIRTTHPDHAKSVQEIFKRLMQNGDVYKGKYKGLYCLSCEAYMKQGDLVNGKCPNHGTEPTVVEEENYFFKLSSYTEKIKNLIKENPSFVEPSTRRNEVLGMLDEGMEDISISRAKKRWGVSVPGDPDHVIYVWFDALINYITAIGFSTDQQRFEKFWPADVQIVGKDIIKFHCIIWPAMLLSAGLQLPKQIFAHGFINFRGLKLSKTTGNVVHIPEPVDKFGCDATRYFMMREFSFREDGDYIWENFDKRYNGELVNDLGNLTHRVSSMINQYQEGLLAESSSSLPQDGDLKQVILSMKERYFKNMDSFAFHDALGVVWEGVRKANVYVEQTTPWALAKQGESAKLAACLYNLSESIRIISRLLYPFMPSTSTTFLKQFSQDPAPNFDETETWGKIKPQTRVAKINVLFPRLK